MLKEQGRTSRAIEIKSGNSKLLDQAKSEYSTLSKIVDKELGKKKVSDQVSNFFDPSSRNILPKT